MTARGKTALSLRVFTVASRAGALLLSLSVVHAQPAAPRVPVAPPAKPKTPPSSPAKPAPKQPKAPLPPASTTTPAPRVEAPATGDNVTKLPPLPPVDTTKPPPMLPRAGRNKMRACAEEWDDLKRRTKVGELTWRAFATKCLTR